MRLKYFEAFQDLDLDELEKRYSYFHLSLDLCLLDKEMFSFTFSPRIPSQPYGFEYSIIEDNFTKRVSLSDSIKGCLDSLPEDAEGTWFIYGSNNVDLISVRDNFHNCPIGYGVDFDLLNWIKGLDVEQYTEILDYIGILTPELDVSDLPIRYRDLFYGCVPLFNARFDKENQYEVETKYNNITETHKVFKWQGKYHISKTQSVNEDYIVKITKVPETVC